jgi:hypothetical protein
MRLNLTPLDAFVFGFIALVVVAFRVNIGIERYPPAVRRPDWIAGTCGDARYLLFIAAVSLHRPDLAASEKGYQLAIRRPPRRRA